MPKLLMMSAGVCAALVAAACAIHTDRQATTAVTDRVATAGPRVLCVTAHPDDETVFAGTLYKISTHLGGVCDIAVITNGEGGFKYSTLAERVYGVELTEEAVGRRELPRIRRREMLAACKVLEVRDVFFLDQQDHRYTQDPGEVLAPASNVWDLALVRSRLRSILEGRGYDFLFTMAPVPETHGHHQAATILALEVVKGLPPRRRPVVLCAQVVGHEEPAAAPPGIKDYLITRVREDVGPWVFDRTRKFGFKKRLDYRIVVNWVIAAHRSQGTMQLAMNRGDEERFFLFALNEASAPDRATRLFKALAEPQFRTRVYGSSAGTNAIGR